MERERRERERREREREKRGRLQYISVIQKELAEAGVR